MKFINIFHISKNRATRLLLIIMALAVIANINAANVVYAEPLSAAQKAVYNSGVLHHDVGAEPGICSENGNGSFATNRGVYVLGDSYGGGYSAPLTSKLKAKGYSDIVINYSSGRSISGTGKSPKTSGLEAVEADKNTISNKGVIIIELGTNPESDFKDNQEKLLKEIQKINSTAKYYWVNVGNYDDIDETETNNILTENANNFNYTVIDWKSVADKKYFEKDDVHPTTNGGYAAYSDTIDESIETPPATSTSGSSVASSGFFTTDASKSAPERVWQFLTSSDGMGLNASQAAGAMGNIHQETGGTFNPNTKEGDGGPGRGLIQWTTGGRKARLEDFKASYKTDSSGNPIFQDLLDLQLNFMRFEMSKWYKETFNLLKTVDAETFKSSMNVNDAVIAATLVFHGTSDNFTVPGIPYGKGYEASGDTLDFVINTRGKDYAYDALKKYGDIDLASIGTNLGCATATSGVAGLGGWDLDAMTRYNQGGDDPWTTKQFTCGTLKACGCPAISAATIISTLTTTKIDPGELIDAHPGRQSWSNIPTKYGLKRTELSTDAAGFANAATILSNGGLVMVHITNGGYFIDKSNHDTHYFIIRKVEGDKFFIYFLYEGDYNNVGYTASQFIEGGLTEMWGYTK